MGPRPDGRGSKSAHLARPAPRGFNGAAARPQNSNPLPRLGQVPSPVLDVAVRGQRGGPDRRKRRSRARSGTDGRARGGKASGTARAGVLSTGTRRVWPATTAPSAPPRAAEARMPPRPGCPGTGSTGCSSGGGVRRGSAGGLAQYQSPLAADFAFWGPAVPGSAPRRLRHVPPEDGRADAATPAPRQPALACILLASQLVLAGIAPKAPGRRPVSDFGALRVPGVYACSSQKGARSACAATRRTAAPMRKNWGPAPVLRGLALPANGRLASKSRVY